MLKSIKCEKFRLDGKEIQFSKSLNIVKGDDNATNSIGKSTFLMVIDFVMGGGDFLKQNKDVIEELGHHSYYFSFEFDSELYFFRRDTNEPNFIIVCDENFKITETIDLKSYQQFLTEKYDSSNLMLSFRDLVSLFIRVWGRSNLDVSMPLHVVPKKANADIILFLLKLFDKYKDLEGIINDLKSSNEKKKSLNEAFKSSIVKKIKKTEYKNNLKTIEDINKELEIISNNLAFQTLNINELIGNDVYELQNIKNNFLKERSRLKSKIYRIDKSIKETKYFKSNEYEALLEYFPNINKDKIDEVENFHEKISEILNKEIKTNKQQLLKLLKEVESEIIKIDKAIQSKLNNFSINIPKTIINKVIDLSQQKSIVERENHYYDEAKTLQKSVKEEEVKFKEKRDLKLFEITTSINDMLRSLTNDIYDEQKKSPKLTFQNNNYSYNLYRDTGTGKAYWSMLLLDFAIFKLTSLPFLIHDSLLFKNIENNVMLDILITYSSFNKQSFISIDEIKKYGSKAIEIIENNKVLELSNSQTLYIKDWRKN